MAVVLVERPAGSYTSTSTTTNSTKYGTDSTLSAAISSGKVDGDMNKLVDGINTIASYDASGSYASLEASVAQIKVNEDGIASLVAGTIPDADYGDIVVSSGATIWTIDTDAVTTAKILDNNVTLAKLASGTANVLLGFDASGDPSEITLASSLNSAAGVLKVADLGVDSLQIAADAVTLAKMASGTAGNIITYDASGDPAAVVTGTATQVLTSNGAGTAPTFEDAPIPSSASTTVEGIVELATDAEVLAGTDTARVAPVSAMNAHNGMAKSWVHLDTSGTFTVRDSYNVTSVTDNSTGDYTVNFDTNFTNTYYTVAGCAGGGSNNQLIVTYGITTSIAVGSCRLRTIVGSNGAVQDCNSVSISFFGEQ